jgi:hypothetical protein
LLLLLVLLLSLLLLLLLVLWSLSNSDEEDDVVAMMKKLLCSLRSTKIKQSHWSVMISTCSYVGGWKFAMYSAPFIYTMFLGGEGGVTTTIYNMCLIINNQPF